VLAAIQAINFFDSNYSKSTSNEDEVARSFVQFNMQKFSKIPTGLRKGRTGWWHMFDLSVFTLVTECYFFPSISKKCFPILLSCEDAGVLFLVSVCLQL